jgi:phosphoglycerate dehydrogenase-like enzyme
VSGPKVIAEAVLREAVECGKALAAVLDTREGESLSQSSGLVWLMLITRSGV